MSDKAILSVTGEIKKRLESFVPDFKIKVTENPDGDVIKAHVPSLDNQSIKTLNAMCQVGCKVSAKRSGTGISLIIKCPTE